MGRNNFIAILVFILFGVIQGSASVNNTEANRGNSNVYDAQNLYEQMKSDPTNVLPSWEAFSLAVRGYNNLKATSGKVKKDILTVADFSLASSSKRLWVIDLAKKKVLYNDWVAHGKKSGNNFAKMFSNQSNSNASSIGFYVTGETYSGKHGLSLRLDGMDNGFNDNARNRSIVIHGAKYVSADFIKKYGRLGRSLGCPSLSMSIYKDVIDTICNGSILFIYSPNADFVAKSPVLHSIPDEIKRTTATL